MEPIHFFRAGKHTATNGTQVAFSEAQLAGIAAAYDPKRHEAPIVVGHPKNDAPAYGWVEKIIARPDGLYAVPRQVSPEFADLVRQGAYKKVSGSFYSPDHPNHPSPGSYYLRHLGFLGAQPPAVKGLRAIELADDDDAIINLEDSVLDLREFSLSERERGFRRREVRGEVERLNREGRIPIGDVDGLVAFMDSLTDDRIVNFSEDDVPATKPQAEWFLDYLRRRPVQVETKEIAAGGAGDEAAPRFVAPENYTVDPDLAEIDRLAALHQREKGGSYADAVRAVAQRLEGRN